MQRYKLYGGGGSPYSQKMRAILHYRRLPFDWVQITPDIRKQIQHDGPPVIPVLRLPEDDSLHVDSTPLAYMLEDRHQDRSLIPTSPAVAYLSDLIEDMGDEWCTKMMFHYRWYREVDRQYSSRQIISDNSPGLRGQALQKAAEAICDRQVSRMPLVGCTLENAPIIEASYHELLEILESFVVRDEFLFGTRPSLGDFGLFGQLKTLASDHTPMLIMRNEAPSTFDWVRRLEDASGIDGHWQTLDELRPAVTELLKFTAKYYLPFLQANDEALANGDDSVTLEIDGKPYHQPTFRYQQKCYDRLKKRLVNDATLQDLLDETGCLKFLTSS